MKQGNQGAVSIRKGNGRAEVSPVPRWNFLLEFQAGCKRLLEPNHHSLYAHLDPFAHCYHILS